MNQTPMRPTCMRPTLGSTLGQIGAMWLWAACLAGVCPIVIFAQQETLAPLGTALEDPSNPIARLFEGQRLDLWSLQAIRDHQVPERNIVGLEHPIDRFVFDGLRADQVQSPQRVSKEHLLQRMTLDLIGLRAGAAQVTDFVQDHSPDWLEKQIDRLLGDPRFGEHWARFWLDAVRYSDSNGFDWDEYR
ncbi:MAG: DUF1549 domain-containing protein, partial [Acidobacteria bacterium]|nr:DUF1549 domain-containing protein [Acidobacteriota bacterium]